MMPKFGATNVARPRAEFLERPSRPADPVWEAIPDDLTTRGQWVCWAYLFVNGRWTKVPFQPDGTKASVTNPATWARFEDVQCAYYSPCAAKHEDPFDGVGFVLTLNDPFVAFDFDHCIDRETGKITDLKVRDYVIRLDSYTEISPSGSGLRLIVRAKLPQRDRRSGRFECYECTASIIPVGVLPQPRMLLPR
jgi:primase-polymerase (primpol)-like protein